MEPSGNLGLSCSIMSLPVVQGGDESVSGHSTLNFVVAVISIPFTSGVTRVMDNEQKGVLTPQNVLLSTN